MVAARWFVQAGRRRALANLAKCVDERGGLSEEERAYHNTLNRRVYGRIFALLYDVAFRARHLRCEVVRITDLTVL